MDGRSTGRPGASGDRPGKSGGPAGQSRLLPPRPRRRPALRRRHRQFPSLTSAKTLVCGPLARFLPHSHHIVKAQYHEGNSRDDRRHSTATCTSHTGDQALPLPACGPHIRHQGAGVRPMATCRAVMCHRPRSRVWHRSHRFARVVAARGRTVGPERLGLRGRRQHQRDVSRQQPGGQPSDQLRLRLPARAPRRRAPCALLGHTRARRHGRYRAPHRGPERGSPPVHGAPRAGARTSDRAGIR